MNGAPGMRTPGRSSEVAQPSAIVQATLCGSVGEQSPYLEDLEVGLPAAAHATAAGKALLSTMPSSRRRSYLEEQGLRPFTARTTTDRERLEADLASVRPGAPVVGHGEFRDGVSCAAALVRRDDPADPWWAVVVSARAAEVPAPVEERLLAAAADLSAR